MYTEKSIDLKNDFYARYGLAQGKLYFERVGVPCVLLCGGGRMLSFAMACGARAYGRGYGDVLRLIRDDGTVCEVRFVGGGRGAQILYGSDSASIPGAEAAENYAVAKLLERMSVGDGVKFTDALVQMTDSYGSGGWAAYFDCGKVSSVPLPLYDYNVLFIRVGGTYGRRIPIEDRTEFERGEAQRIISATEGLRRCRTDVLFEMMNRSQQSIRRLLSPRRRALTAADIAADAPGAEAVRIGEKGIVCICDKEMTDSAARHIAVNFQNSAGYAASITVVK